MNDMKFLREFEDLLKKYGVELAVLCYEDNDGKMSLAEMGHQDNAYKGGTLANAIIGCMPEVMKEVKRIEAARN